MEDILNSLHDCSQTSLVLFLSTKLKRKKSQDQNEGSPDIGQSDSVSRQIAFHSLFVYGSRYTQHGMASKKGAVGKQPRPWSSLDHTAKSLSSHHKKPSQGTSFRLPCFLLPRSPLIPLYLEIPCLLGQITHKACLILRRDKHGSQDIPLQVLNLESVERERRTA